MRLDSLQPLVEQRGAVDSDLVAHLPSRMTQRLVGCYTGQVVQGEVAEGAAGARKDDAGDAGPVFAPEALPDGAVLAVDGAQLGAMLAGGGPHPEAGPPP